jgi:Ca2+-binding RTX toxin-like protein
VNGVNFSGMETLNGGSQVDTFKVHTGGSFMGAIQGGTGADVLDFTLSAGPVVVNLETNSATGIADFSSIALVVGSPAADTLIGADNGNTWDLTAPSGGSVDAMDFSGFELLQGGSAADTFKPAPGVAFTGTIDGYSGVDKLDYGAHTVAVIVNLGSGSATGVGLVVNVENVTGGDSNDRLVGSASNNVLSGGNGNDVLIGGAGDDTLDGDNGRDLVIGGSGADRVHGNAADDILVGGFATYGNEITHAVNHSALDAIMAEWTRTDLTYAARVAHLLGTTGGGINGSNLLNSSSVFGDATIDLLFGDASLDWFLTNLEDDVNSVGGEIVTQV